MSDRTPSCVLVVGAGPVGLALALALCRLGVSVRVIDRASGQAVQSRALDVQARTLELYQPLGVAERVVERGVRIEQVTVRDRGHTVVEVDVSGVGAGLSPYPYILCCPQDDHESVLIDSLAAAGVEVEWDTELVSLREAADCVNATVSRPDGTVADVVVSYLGGCDGAHSTVRQQLDISFPGGSYSADYFVADVKSTGAPAPSSFDFCLSAQDFILVVPARRTGTQRFIGLVPARLTEGDVVSFEDLRATAERAVGSTVDTLNWFSTYQVSHRVADRFRVGRTFLLGDAGHVHSPLGGQGMNTGIADAMNLAWKLAAVLDGRASPQLLDTYQRERLGVARTLVRTTDAAFTIIAGSRPAHRVARRVIFRLLLPLLLRQSWTSRALAKRVSQLTVGYRSSPLSSGRTGRVRGGDRLPWVEVQVGQHNLDPLNELDWQLHVYGDVDEQLRELALSRGLSLHQFPWSAGARRAGLRRDNAYLVRPDGYLAVAVKQQRASQVEAFLEQWQIIPRSPTSAPQSRAVELPAIGERLCEAEVVVDRREQAESASDEHVRRRRRIGGRHVDALVGTRERRVDKVVGVVVLAHEVRQTIHRGESVQLVVGHSERSARHADRAEYTFGEEVAERLIGNDLDEPCGNVDSDRVVEALSRLKRERQRSDQVDALLKRAGRIVHDSMIAVELGSGIVHHEVVGEAAGVAEQVADGDRGCGVDDRPVGLHHFRRGERR